MIPKNKRLISASDTHAWDHCTRLAWFAFHASVDEAGAPSVAHEPDQFSQLIQAMGEDHEARILSSFAGAVTAESVAHTQTLMEKRTPVIYQPQFLDTDLGVQGTPDFLLLTENGYQVADVKLAMSVEKNRAIKTQLGVYQHISDTDLPAVVFLGDGDAVELSDEISALSARFLTDMTALADEPNMPDTHFGFSKCQVCLYHDYCVEHFEAQDEMTLSPAIDARTGEQLKRQGFQSLSDIASAQFDDIEPAPFLRNPDKRQRIISQAQSLKSGEVIIRKTPEWPTGTLVHFDVESDPMAADGAGEVYLWGLLTPPYDQNSFEAVWRETDDVDTWRAFLATIAACRLRYPNLILVHYSHYERAQIQRYAERYSGFDDPTVQWLLADDGPLWDLQHFLKLHYILPVRSYGLKAICRDPRLVNFHWRDEQSGSQWSVVRYYDYVAAMAEAKVAEAHRIRDEILTYNEDDVRATAAVVDWLGGLV